MDTARALPQVAIATSDQDTEVRDYADAVERLAQSPRDNDPVYISPGRGDVACLLYRRPTLMNVRLAENTTRQILSIWAEGHTGSVRSRDEETTLAEVISTPFQFLCVLFSADSFDSLKMIPEVLPALLQINEVSSTQTTKEAYETAQLLIQIAQQKKEKGAWLLEGRFCSHFDRSKYDHVRGMGGYGY